MGKRSEEEIEGRRRSEEEFEGSRRSEEEFVGRRRSEEEFEGRRRSEEEFVGKRSEEEIEGRRRSEVSKRMYLHGVFIIYRIFHQLFSGVNDYLNNQAIKCNFFCSSHLKKTELVQKEKDRNIKCSPT